MRPGPSTMLERYKGLYKLQAKHRIPTHRCDIGRGQSGQGAFLVQGEGRAFRTPEELLSAVGSVRPDTAQLQGRAGGGSA